MSQICKASRPEPPRRVNGRQRRLVNHQGGRRPGGLRAQATHLFSVAVLVALSDGEWRTTPQIGRAMGLEWAPGSHGLRRLRDTLYALWLVKRVELEPRHNGHRWRLAR